MTSPTQRGETRPRCLHASAGGRGVVHTPTSTDSYGLRQSGVREACCDEAVAANLARVADSARGFATAVAAPTELEVGLMLQAQLDDVGFCQRDKRGVEADGSCVVFARSEADVGSRAESCE